VALITVNASSGAPSTITTLRGLSGGRRLGDPVAVDGRHEPAVVGGRPPSGTRARSPIWSLNIRIRPPIPWPEVALTYQPGPATERAERATVPLMGALARPLLLRTELVVDHLGQRVGEDPEILAPVDAGEFVEEPGYGLGLSVRQHR